METSLKEMIQMEEPIENTNNYLEHHGIKGQKWGVRRTPEELGYKLKKRNARHYGKYNKAVKRIASIQGSKNISELTDKDKAKIEKATTSAQKYLEAIKSDSTKYSEKIKSATEREEKKAEKSALKEEKQKIKDIKDQEKQQIKDAREQEKAEKKAIKTAEKEKKYAEKQAKEEEKTRKFKEELIESQDWNKVYENKKLFSDQELNQIANRVSAEKRLKQEMQKGTGLDKLNDNIRKVASTAQAGLELYDKVNKIKGIFDDGKKEKAYSEIRQLMADGKNAEVIKKSVGISDKDIENFTKRNTFLNNLRGKGDESSTSDKTTNYSDTLREMMTNTEYKKFSKAINDAIKPEGSKSLFEQIKSTTGSEKVEGYKTDYGSESGSWNRESLRGTVEGAGSSQRKQAASTNQNGKTIIDVPYEEVKDSAKNYPLYSNKEKYELLVLNDIGSYKLSDLKR